MTSLAVDNLIWATPIEVLRPSDPKKSNKSSGPERTISSITMAVKNIALDVRKVGKSSDYYVLSEAPKWHYNLIKLPF